MSKHYIFAPTGSQDDNLYTANTLYTIQSNAGAFGGNTEYLKRNLLKEDINMIFIPQIFYGSGLKKGSVNLKFYISGTLLAECSDIRENGELVETTGSTVVNGTGSVVGLVMYNEGVIMLTGSENLETGPALNIKYAGHAASAVNSSWMYFAAGLNDNIAFGPTIKQAAFNIDFKGTNHVNTMTMFCHAKKGELNYSNNPTFKKQSSVIVPNDITSSQFAFSENEADIKNIASSSYRGIEEKFEKTTYLSKIALYDDEGNMIGVASMATPVKKTEERDFTFKLKVDI